MGDWYKLFADKISQTLSLLDNMGLVPDKISWKRGTEVDELNQDFLRNLFYWCVEGKFFGCMKNHSG